MKIILPIILILGISLLGSVAVLSKNQPLLEGGFKEIISFVYGGEEEPVVSDFTIISINPIRTKYNGNYEVFSKSGNESLYDVIFEKKQVLTDSYIDNETKEIINIYREDTIICLEADFDTKEIMTYSDEKSVITYNYSVPETLSLYKTNLLIKESDIEKELIKADTGSLEPFKEGDINKFCYQANPEEDFYLKFGENSIEIIQAEDVIAGLLSNVTAESGDANFTHLNISTTAPYDSLVGYWSFDGDNENSKLNKSYDFSKYNNDGDMVADAVVNSTNCIYGDCLQLDGDGDYVSIPHSDSLNLNGYNDSYSISLWAKGDSQGGTYRLIEKLDSFVQYPVSMQGDAGEDLQLCIYDGALNPCNDIYGIWNGSWHHIVFVVHYADDNLYSYLDGDLVGTNTNTVTSRTNNTHSLIIGSRYGSSRYFNGTIDEVMIFNTSLTQAQITDIYNNQSARFVKEGTQKVRAVNITDSTNWDNAGYNRVNLTTTYEANLNSNISARIGQMNFSVNVSGLVLYMPFEWGSAVDISGEGNDGTITDAVFNSTGGLNDTGGFEFDGSGDYVTIANPNYNLMDFTAVAWVKVIAETADWSIFGSVTGSYIFQVYRRYSLDRFQVLYGDGATTDGAFVSFPPIQLGQWQQWAVTKQGGSFVFYMDGVVLGTDSEDAIAAVTGTDLLIGNSQGTYEFNGSIDDVLIFNRALSPTEISTLYTQSASKYHEAYYTDYQNITNAETNFTINPEADFIFPDFKFFAGNSSHPFYTPILLGDITLETWNYTGVPTADTTAPTFSAFADNSTATTPTNGTDVQLNLTITDGTAIDFYRIATNNTDGNTLTNQTLIDASDSTSLTAIFNESIAWFPTTGGTLGVRFWANDTGGYAGVSDIHTITIQPIVTDTCSCPSPAERWGIDLADNCEITTDCDVRPYETYCYGTAGGLGIYANLYTRNFTCNFDNVLMNKSGNIWIERNP